MQSSTSGSPSRPAGDPAATPAGRQSGTPVGRAGTEDRLTAELAAVVVGARRRAVRDGDRQTDTAHLLHALVEAAPAVRDALGAPRAARVLAYLVQRSIGYGLRWHGTVERSGAPPLVPGPARHGWSPAAAAALDLACARARARGEQRAHPLDLLAGLTADPDCRAVQVLARAGVDRGRLNARIEHPSQQVSPPLRS
ncbi:Clp protease N-terminal domain-containing protein [Streptomyces thermolilacinus]|uniref:Clp protease N-terminal domain-containing protein n=1 Tax=Streptomyces thermolilacinus TaxID=285540 RepID=UPI0033E00F5C